MRLELVGIRWSPVKLTDQLTETNDDDDDDRDSIPNGQGDNFSENQRQPCAGRKLTLVNGKSHELSPSLPFFGGEGRRRTNEQTSHE